MNARREFLLAAALLAAAPFASRAAGAPLKIATVGAGHIGGALGGLWLKAGHPVFFSSRHPEELHDLVNRLGPLAQAGGVADAVAFADVVLLAVPYRALPQIGKEHAAALAAKLLVLDACNPFPSRDGEIAVWARETGAGLATAELLPGARLVRAFNAIGYSRLPELGRHGGVGMPIAGDDAKAIDAASGLIREIGLEPVLIGPLAMGRHLIPGTPLAGEHTPEEIRSIVAALDK
jgi:8-hydroxy-5-deazaflavin:NADPH oxidoreductase